MVRIIARYSRPIERPDRARRSARFGDVRSTPHSPSSREHQLDHVLDRRVHDGQVEHLPAPRAAAAVTVPSRPWERAASPVAIAVDDLAVRGEVGCVVLQAPR